MQGMTTVSVMVRAIEQRIHRPTCDVDSGIQLGAVVFVKRLQLSTCGTGALLRA